MKEHNDLKTAIDENWNEKFIIYLTIYICLKVLEKIDWNILFNIIRYELDIFLFILMCNYRIWMNPANTILKKLGSIKEMFL